MGYPAPGIGSSRVYPGWRDSNSLCKAPHRRWPMGMYHQRFPVSGMSQLPSPEGAHSNCHAQLGVGNDCAWDALGLRSSARAAMADGRKVLAVGMAYSFQLKAGDKEGRDGFAEKGGDPTDGRLDKER